MTALTQAKSTHTPGPWLTEPGDTIICVWSTAENNSYRIADVGGMPYWKRFTEIDMANARLIAAAPDLLAALHHLLKWWDEDDMDHEVYDEAERHARAAIAKAEGTAQ